MSSDGHYETFLLLLKDFRPEALLSHVKKSLQRLILDQLPAHSDPRPVFLPAPPGRPGRHHLLADPAIRSPGPSSQLGQDDVV